MQKEEEEEVDKGGSSSMTTPGDKESRVGGDHCRQRLASTRIALRR